MAEITQHLSAIKEGDSFAADRLLQLVYNELRQLALQRLARERPGQTLQATALVHEAYLRLLGSNAAHLWDSHEHFFAAVAEAMRRILVEQARRKNALKRGGCRQRVELNEIAAPSEVAAIDILAVDDALGQLADVDPQAAQLVKLRFFSGLSGDDPVRGDEAILQLPDAEREGWRKLSWDVAKLEQRAGPCRRGSRYREGENLDA
jgi:RNA polymerase sigma factor (TIGR02999 family)